MKKLDKKEKKSLLHKLLEFKRTGLIAYSKYLATQLEQSEGRSERKAYTRYIKKELVSTAKKIARMDEKLTKYTAKLAKAAKKAKPETTVKPVAAKPAATAVAKPVKKEVAKPAAQATKARAPRPAAAASKQASKVAPKAAVAPKKPSASS